MIWSMIERLLSHNPCASLVVGSGSGMPVSIKENIYSKIVEEPRFERSRLKRELLLNFRLGSNYVTFQYTVKWGGVRGLSRSAHTPRLVEKIIIVMVFTKQAKVYPFLVKPSTLLSHRER